MNPITTLYGDALEQLATLPPESVQCCVTSPPYWGLRSYLPKDHPLKPLEIGQEKTPQEYVDKLVAVFREVRRVLRKDGTLWLNLGDSYAGSGKARGGGGCGPKSQKQVTNRGAYFEQNDGCEFVPDGLKPKDLIGIPWRVAFALQADGWYLRQDLIWAKPNPMPESVTDRCTKAHEYLFLLSKSAQYYYDAEAIKEPCSSVNPKIPWRERTYGTGQGVGELNGEGSYKRGTSRQPCGNPDNGLRNKRSVWNIPTQPFKGAHFATFPVKLVQPCVRAGSRPGDTLLDPFAGSGTTAQVALTLQRQAILIELNPSYQPLIQARTQPLASEVQAVLL